MINPMTMAEQVRVAVRSVGAATVLAVLVLTGCGAGGSTANEPSSSPTQATVAASEELGETSDAHQFAELVGRDGVVVLDVRTPEEFAAGHLPDALNINVADADFAEQIAALDQGTTYAIYCRSGNRSQTALEVMREAGFTELHHLGGGISAWQAAGYPVVQ